MRQLFVVFARSLDPVFPAGRGRSQEPGNIKAGWSGHVFHHTLPSRDLPAQPPLWPMFLDFPIFLFDFNPGVYKL